MAWFDYLWLEGDGGNIEHIAEHGLKPEDIEHVMENFTSSIHSNTTATYRPSGVKPKRTGRPLL